MSLYEETTKCSLISKSSLVYHSKHSGPLQTADLLRQELVLKLHGLGGPLSNRLLLSDRQ